jgi:hypothetical protein
VSDKVKAEKPKPDHKKYLVVQCIMNLIGVVVVVAFLAWIVFGLFGPGSGTWIEVRTFMLLFLLCFVVIQCHTAVVNTRRDFIRGRWVMGDPGGLEPDGVVNPWKRLAPLAVPAGIVISLAAWLLFPLIGGGSFRLLTIDAMAFVPLFLGTSVLLVIILPRDQVSFSSALHGNKAKPVSGFPAYFLREHLLPWAVIQGLINLGIGVKQFKWVLEGTNPSEVITSSLVGWDFGIVFGILYFFMFLSSDAQVRADARLGRLAQKQFKMATLSHVGVPLTAVGVVLSTALIMFAVGLVMQGIFAVAGADRFPFETAVAFKTLAAVLGTLLGCGVGVWWGRRKESALMAGGESENPTG